MCNRNWYEFRFPARLFWVPWGSDLPLRGCDAGGTRSIVNGSQDSPSDSEAVSVTRWQLLSFGALLPSPPAQARVTHGVISGALRTRTAVRTTAVSSSAVCTVIVTPPRYCVASICGVPAVVTVP